MSTLVAVRLFRAGGVKIEKQKFIRMFEDGDACLLGVCMA
jgi:hypothetical protein